jgi:hypothetical protein
MKFGTIVRPGSPPYWWRLALVSKRYKNSHRSYIALQNLTYTMDHATQSG